jgi:hypothetical protein
MEETGERRRYLEEVARLTAEVEGLDVPRDVLRDLHLVGLETERMRLAGMVLEASAATLAEVKLAQARAEEAFSAFSAGDKEAGQRVKELSEEAQVAELMMKLENADAMALSNALKAEVDLVRSAEFIRAHDAGELSRSVKLAVAESTKRLWG